MIDITKLKAIIFARYLGQRTSELYLIEPLAIYDMINYKIVGNIMLKPLSKLTDDDAIAVAKLIYKTKLDKIDRARDLYVAMMQSFVLEDDTILHFDVHQYLSMMGYALPQTVVHENIVQTYSVDELVTLGIYKLI
jgi:hypothetical protein